MYMKRKKILIVVPSFSIGGTIVSLNSLLSLIDTSKYDIDVFALNRSGEYLDRLPNCTILPENTWLSYIAHTLGLQSNIINKTLRIIRAGCRRLGWSIERVLCQLADKQINFSQYDTVVSYVESVANVVCHYPAKRRVAWIHCDYKRFRSLIMRDETKVYKNFNKVVCVSEFAKAAFIECIPTMASKVVAIHNVINVDDIKQKAKAPIDDKRFNTENYTIVSAGRLDPVKQFHLIPQLAADIKRKTDKKFVWYIIGGNRGFSEYVDKIKQDIECLGLSEQVVLLGEKSNVYPYMAKANLYACTSLSESFPLVINEAKALGVPIVSNNFGSAAESIEDGTDGFVSSIDDGSFSDQVLSILSGQVKWPIRNAKRVFADKNLSILNKIYKVF